MENYNVKLWQTIWNKYTENRKSIWNINSYIQDALILIKLFEIFFQSL